MEPKYKVGDYIKDEFYGVRQIYTVEFNCGKYKYWSKIRGLNVYVSEDEPDVQFIPKEVYESPLYKIMNEDL